MRSVVVEGATIAALVQEGTGPAVVFDAGLGGWSLYWQPVVDLLSGQQVVAWDRPGFGDSASDPALRTADDVARRWRASLQALGVAPPYVLVGHSLAGHHVRAFAASWPDEVAGLVLVDVSTARRPTGPVRRWLTRTAARRRDPQAGAARLLARFPTADQERAQQVLTSTTYREAVLHELSCVDTRAEVLRRPLPDVPVEVLSGAGAELDQLSPVLRRVLRLDRVIARIHAAHRDAAASVPRGRWTVVPQSSHHLPLEHPAAVADAVRRVLHTASLLP